MWFSCFFHQKEKEEEEEEEEIHSMANYEHYICKPQTILCSLIESGHHSGISGNIG